VTGQTGDAVFDADADAGGLDARLELQLVFNELFDQLVIHDGILMESSRPCWPQRMIAARRRSALR